ncbi:MAG: hypothetical protein AB7S48_03740 [Bacteroidales bacterium]
MKNTVSILTFLAIFVGLSGSCCKDLHSDIYLDNNSGQAIYYGLSYSYPDTSINKISQVPGYDGNISHKIASGEQNILPATNFAYNSTMQVFIFDASTIETTPWDSIVAHSMVLKRYQFTVNDMEQCNWTITYP